MKFVRRAWPYVLLLMIIAAGAALIWKHDQILDWTVLRNYQAPANVVQLGADDGMTAYAKRLFYVNQPSIDDKQEFSQHCSNAGDESVVLGCFTGNRRGIYIYDVTDPRLSGVEQVTAAHEMLHQAYERVGSKERAHLNQLLQDYYDNGASDALRKQIDSYQKTEPDQLHNEMHSIFGTQAASLPAELEDYYKQYFADRHKIVSYYNQYESEFDKRRDEVVVYDEQLNSIKQQIDDGKTELKSREATLSQRRAQLDAYLNNNQIPQYNAAVPGFNALVDAYRSLFNATNALIAQYNHLLAQRNAIAIQEQELQKALDSHIAPAGQQE
jgi:hypothetical protein